MQADEHKRVTRQVQQLLTTVQDRAGDLKKSLTAFYGMISDPYRTAPAPPEALDDPNVVAALAVSLAQNSSLQTDIGLRPHLAQAAVGRENLYNFFDSLVTGLYESLVFYDRDDAGKKAQAVVFGQSLVRTLEGVFLTQH